MCLIVAFTNVNLKMEKWVWPFIQNNYLCHPENSIKNNQQCFSFTVLQINTPLLFLAYSKGFFNHQLFVYK